MSEQLVQEIKNLMKEKSSIILLLKKITHKLTQNATYNDQLLNLHIEYHEYNKQIEELDNKINALVEILNQRNSQQLQHLFSYKETYTSDIFREKISDISTKVRNEYETIMNMDKKLIKDLYKINKFYHTVLKSAD